MAWMHLPPSVNGNGQLPWTAGQGALSVATLSLSRYPPGPSVHPSIVSVSYRDAQCQLR
jgi:hypothetical protein